MQSNAGLMLALTRGKSKREIREASPGIHATQVGGITLGFSDAGIRLAVGWARFCKEMGKVGFPAGGSAGGGTLPVILSVKALATG